MSSKYLDHMVDWRDMSSKYMDHMVDWTHLTVAVRHQLHLSVL